MEVIMGYDAKAPERSNPETNRYANSYLLSNRDMSSPYVANYVAAKSQRMEARAQISRNSYKRAESYDDLESGRGAGGAKTRTLPMKSKRGFFVILLLVLVLAYVAVAALSFFAVMPEYTSLFSKTPVNEGDPRIEISDRDVVMGFVKSFMPDLAEASYFYDECMVNISTVGTVEMIAYYALPIAFALGLIIAVVFLVRLLVAAFTPKRRKLFVLSGILMLVMNLLVVFAGFIWAAGMNFAEIMNFIPFVATVSLPIMLAYGGIIMLGISLLVFIFSFFAYRSKKKVQ